MNQIDTSQADALSRPVVHRMRVRFIEVDIQGVVHNAHYLAYFSLGLAEYWRALQYDRRAAHNNPNLGLFLVNVNIQYKAPLLLEDEADISTRIAKIGNTSVRFEYEIHKVRPALLSAFGYQVWVSADRTTREPVPWDPSFEQAVRRFSAEPRNSPLA